MVRMARQPAARRRQAAMIPAPDFTRVELQATVQVAVRMAALVELAAEMAEQVVLVPAAMAALAGELMAAPAAVAQVVAPEAVTRRGARM